MKPLDYAMQIELEGATLYRSLADNSPNQELKTLFNWLADSEVGHYKIFMNMKKGNIELPDDNTLLDDTNNVLKEVKGKNNRFNLKVNPDIYSDILDIERKMADFYERKAEETKDSKLKEVFQNIAKEESRHQYIIENLIRFVNNPEIWLKTRQTQGNPILFSSLNLIYIKAIQ